MPKSHAASKDLSAWIAALDERNTKALKRLARKGPPPPMPDGTPLLHRAGTRMEVEMLLACGADPAATDAEGRTALHEAARKLSLPVLNRLLEEGVYPGVRCLKGRTPLHEAARTGRLGKAREITERLIEARTPVDVQDHKKRTAAHYAAKNGRAGVLIALREAGARFDLIDKDGIKAIERATGGKPKMGPARFLIAQDSHANEPRMTARAEPPVPAPPKRRRAAH